MEPRAIPLSEADGGIEDPDLYASRIDVPFRFTDPMCAPSPAFVVGSLELGPHTSSLHRSYIGFDVHRVPTDGLVFSFSLLSASTPLRCLRAVHCVDGGRIFLERITFLNVLFLRLVWHNEILLRVFAPVLIGRI